MDLVKQILLRCMVEVSGKQGFPYKHASEGDSVSLGGDLGGSISKWCFFLEASKNKWKETEIKGARS